MDCKSPDDPARDQLLTMAVCGGRCFLERRGRDSRRVVGSGILGIDPERADPISAFPLG
jgi:hypothetical protein